MGARVSGAGDDRRSRSRASTRLRGNGSAPHAVVPDRIEAGTYLAAGALITGGDVDGAGARGATSAALSRRARAARAPTSRSRPDGVASATLAPLGRLGRRRRTPHPGFPTDLQAQFLALMTQADGDERASPRRSSRTASCTPRELGAARRRRAHRGAYGAIVRGPTPLEGAPVTASDLRASAALVLAGLVARGETRVRRIYHLDRGYADMDGAPPEPRRRASSGSTDNPRVSQTFDDPACLFCRIGRRRSPRRSRSRTTRVLAFHDVAPKAPTHVLVIPKVHVAAPLGHGARRTPRPRRVPRGRWRGSRATLGLSSYRVVTNDGADAGQSVFHLHFHLMGGRPFAWPPG